ncbi:hypothetical protein [Desulfonatronum thiosulfatophilum]|uniref:hypothetical protein n=1 Tax=Desulfonatronum thiosulfatophilum TaxID=617002 RepID=UPI000B822350|nr:hypothetical protein [Desulfonatronum thiosulfatophilum]
MQTIEFQTRIDNNGHIVLPKKYHFAFGKEAKLLVLLPDFPTQETRKRQPGSAKGILKILAEDSEHLDNFKDYMP